MKSDIEKDKIYKFNLNSKEKFNLKKRKKNKNKTKNSRPILLSVDRKILTKKPEIEIKYNLNDLDRAWCTRYGIHDEKEKV